MGKENWAQLHLMHPGLGYNKKCKTLLRWCCLASVAGRKQQPWGEKLQVYTNSHAHTLTPPASTTSLQAVGCWVITLERLRGQCLAQGHFSSWYRGRNEYCMLGLSGSGMKHKLSYLGLFFISRRSKASHSVKLLIQLKHFWWQCQWAVFHLISNNSIIHQYMFWVLCMYSAR